MGKPTKPYGMSDAEAKDWVRKMPSASAGDPENGSPAGGGKEVNILDIPGDRPAALPKRAPK